MRHLAEGWLATRHNGRRFAPLVLFLALVLGAANASAPAGAQTAAELFGEGERLFRENKPGEAAAVLERAVAAAGPATGAAEQGLDERAWLYLGLAYQQLGRHDEAVNVLRKGLPRASRYRHLYYYNMGNAFVLQGKNSFAAEMFGEAISIDAQYAPAYLNRANARLALRQYRDASGDYGRYLVLDPATPQRAAIEELLRRLGASLAEEDRLKAEAAAQALAAEAARQALLSQVSASLKAAAEETTNLSAGSGQVQGYGDTLELND